MNSDTIWQLVRYTMLAVGGYFVSKGTITSGTLDNLIGYGFTIFTFVWGFYVKWNTKSVPAATAARSDVPTTSAITGAVIK
jgi:hypothetical protein